MSTDKDCNETNHYKFLKLMYGVKEEVTNKKPHIKTEWGSRDKLPNEEDDLFGG